LPWSADRRRGLVLWQRQKAGGQKSVAGAAQAIG